MVITVDSPKIVTINADGKTYNIGTVNSSVADLIADAGITPRRQRLYRADTGYPCPGRYGNQCLQSGNQTVTKNEKIAHKTNKHN